MTTFFAWAAALLLLPLIILFHYTESTQQRAKRFRSQGMTYKAIGERLGFSATKARNLCLA